MAPPAWYERYGRLVENDRLPKTEAARQDLAATIGADGQQLLDAIDAAAGQPELAQLPMVQVLRQVWATQDVAEDGPMRLGSAAELPRSAAQICSPYDPEARYSNKRDVAWVGYKGQVTETCDPACEKPHVIINVETTPATTPDDDMVAVVHQSLETRGLLPGEHLVDKGYTGARVLVDSRQNHGVTIIGPVGPRPELAGAPGRRADQGRVPRRLGPQGGHLPGRQTECFVAAQHPHGKRHGVRGALCDPGLLPVPIAPALHPGQARAPHYRLAGARALRGTAGRAQAPENRGVPGTLSRSRRNRGHARAGHQPLRPAPMPLRRPRQDTLAACSHGGCHQPGQGRGMGRRHPCRENAPLALRRPPNGGLNSPLTSPPASTFDRPQAPGPQRCGPGWRGYAGCPGAQPHDPRSQAGHGTATLISLKQDQPCPNRLRATKPVCGRVALS